MSKQTRQVNTCERCGKQFDIYLSQLKKGANYGRHCSDACKNKRFTDSEVQQIRERAKSESMGGIARSLGVNPTTVRNMVLRITYQDVE